MQTSMRTLRSSTILTLLLTFLLESNAGRLFHSHAVDEACFAHGSATGPSVLRPGILDKPMTLEEIASMTSEENSEENKQYLDMLFSKASELITNDELNEQFLENVSAKASVAYQKRRAIDIIKDFGELADCLGADRSIFIRKELLHAVPAQYLEDAEKISSLTDQLWEGALSAATQAASTASSVVVGDAVNTLVTATAGALAGTVAGDFAGSSEAIEDALADASGKDLVKTAVKLMLTLLKDLLLQHSIGMAVVGVVSLATGGLGTVPALLIYMGGNIAVAFVAKKASDVIIDTTWQEVCRKMHLRNLT